MYGSDWLIPAFPNSSKINACSMKFDTEYVFWMDSDSIVLKDFSGIFGDKKKFDIALSPMTRHTNFGANKEQDEMWNKYFQHFNIKRPQTKIKCYDGELGNFYFTSSFILFRNDINFGERYKYFVDELFKSNLPEKTNRFSQTVLSLILAEQNFRYKILDEKYAYIFHFNDYKLKNDTAICHFCDDMEQFYKLIGVVNG